ncbi:alpha-methylacyl-CoA racemase isoform X2 [Cimex lectularius]|nr:alpha-methylacyl-CoA racemase isoform X2 [Cimex lectularius]XP_014259578.1 alpha-methylacyl-CoA racemase isoform X2 [Cimex lectularius]
MALRGVQVLEIPGLAPGPVCGMILSNFGAKVIRVDKLPSDATVGFDSVDHGKFSMSVDMKNPRGIEIIKHLTKTCDIFLDPYRPGVMENLGLGPADLQKNNQRLIYARLSGFGQTGPLAQKAGHDINFLSISGTLSNLQWEGKPPNPPLNILGDFGGGAFTCALGIILALYERHTSGKGQIVDCSMTRGAAYLSSWIFRTQNTYLWSEPTGKNFLDGGCYFYNIYKTKDGKWMAVGSLEEKFYLQLLEGLNISVDDLPYLSDNEIGKEMLTKRFLEETQDYWIKVFSNLDACVTPVLTQEEAASYEHNKSQNSFQRSADGCLIPHPEPNLSRTPGNSGCYLHPPKCGEHTYTILKESGFNKDEIKQLQSEKIIYIEEKGQAKL